MENKQIKEISDNNLRMKIARQKYFDPNHREDEAVRVDEEDVKKFNKDMADMSLQRNIYFHDK